MLSGASRASAAVLVIDAKEGVAENSKRHGMLLSLLGISQIIVVINKLDLFEYQQDVFENIKKEYLNFLSSLGVYPKAVVPISARTGENIATTSMLMDWYQGLSLLEELDNFSDNQNNNDSFFAMPLQDVYRFSNENDDRRIYAGTIVNGSIEIGDKILFLPSNKEATVANIEAWRSQQKSKALVNESCGLTLREEIYVRSGEVIVKKDEAENFKIKSSDKILVNLIWLGKNPLLKKKKYLFKLGCIKVKAELESVRKVIQISHDTIDSLSQDVEGLHKNEAGSIVLKLSHPIALSNFIDNQSLGRFVLVDGYDAVAGGIILDILGDLRVKNKTESFDSMEGLFEQTQSTKFEDELFDLLHRYFPHRF